MASPKILLVEDDPAQAAPVRRLFMREGYETHLAESLLKADRLLEELRPDLIVLDLNLGDGNGRRLLGRLQTLTPRIPVLILSGVKDTGSRVRALNEGADDFVLKPFHPEELLARIQALLRRSRSQRDELPDTTARWPSPRRIPVGLCILDLHNEELLDRENSARPIKMNRISFSILKLLVSNPDKPLSRDLISTACFGRDHQISSRAIDMHISEIRKTIEPEPKTPRFILTVRSKGYLFKPRNE